MKVKLTLVNKLKEIIQLIRRRNHYFRKAHNSGSTDDRLKFKQLRNKVVAELRLAKHSFFSDLHPHDPSVLEKIEISELTGMHYSNSVKWQY